MFCRADCYSNLKGIITPLNIWFCTIFVFYFFANVNSCFIIMAEVIISHGGDCKMP